MGKWLLDLMWVTVPILGIVLSAMYFRAAQRLYTRDKEHPASPQGARPRAGSSSGRSRESTEPSS
jgi:hypothetical protein